MAANKKTTQNRLRKDQPPPEGHGKPATVDAPARKAAASRSSADQGQEAGQGQEDQCPRRRAKVLGEQGKPLNCQEMIDGHGRQGLLDQSRRQDPIRAFVLGNFGAS